MIGRSWICVESTVVSAFIVVASAKVHQSKETHERLKKGPKRVGRDRATVGRTINGAGFRVSPLLSMDLCGRCPTSAVIGCFALV